MISDTTAALPAAADMLKQAADTLGYDLLTLTREGGCFDRHHMLHLMVEVSWPG